MASKSTDIIEVDVNGGIRNEQLAFLRKVFANAHVNILIGSAFSLEVVPTSVTGSRGFRKLTSVCAIGRVPIEILFEAFYALSTSVL